MSFFALCNCSKYFHCTFHFRPISPYKNSTFKSLPYSQNIKLEIAECDDHFVENNIGKVDHNVAMKGERLSESSLYSFGEKPVFAYLCFK